MLTVDGRILELVIKAVAVSREETRDILDYGQPHVVPDYATYQRYVGYLSGLAFLEKAVTEARSQAEQEAGAPPRAT